jgi:nucleolar protein 4
VISPGTPAAANCEPAELEKRTNSFNARRTMLRSNSALFVSRTRLSVRQIPLFVTERVLKRMAIHAARAFEDEVKEGTRVALTENEMTEAADDDENPEVEEEEGDKKTKQAKKKHVGRGTGVQQTKIVRQQERVDVVTGKGRSKGYGFVEMCKHADALRVLRWANNNRDLGSLFESWWKDELKDLLKAEKEKPENERDKARMKKINEELEGGGARKARGTLIVEFSIENSQVVRRRAAQQKDRDSVCLARTLSAFVPDLCFS